MKKLTRYILILVPIVLACNSERKKDKISENTNTKRRELELTANFLYKNDSFNKAIQYFDTLIKMDSTNGDYYYKRGHSYGRLINKEKAIENYKKAVQLNYRVADSYFGIAIDCLCDNDSLALYYFQKCLEIDPYYYAKAYWLMQGCRKRLEQNKKFEETKRRVKY